MWVKTPIMDTNYKENISLLGPEALASAQQWLSFSIHLTLSLCPMSPYLLTKCTSSDSLDFPHHKLQLPVLAPDDAPLGILALLSRTPGNSHFQPHG